MGVSENREPYYTTLNSRIPIIRTPNSGTPPLIFGYCQIVSGLLLVCKEDEDSDLELPALCAEL